MAWKLPPGDNQAIIGHAYLFHSSQELSPTLPVVQCLKIIASYIVWLSSCYSIIAEIHDKCDVSAKVCYYINHLK